MSKSLPDRPNLDHLRKQAKDLLAAARAGEPQALERGYAIPGGVIALHDAQFVVAREYGFASWAKLVEEVEAIRSRGGITDEVIEEYLRRCVSNRSDRLARFLELYPDLPRANVRCALVSGEPDLVAAWIENGADVSAPMDPDGWAPLVYVCNSYIFKVQPERYDRLTESARLLLDAGADPNGRYQSGGWDLPVLYAATGGTAHAGITKLLLERGANPNDCESMYHSAQLDHEEILELLVQHGGDVSGSDTIWGNTPLYFNAGHRPTDPGVTAARAGMTWLLKHGADPNVQCGANQETTLHVACACGWDGDFIELLLAHGADPSIRRKDGRTALELAIFTGNTQAEEVLRRNGVNVDLKPSEQFLAACVRGDRARAGAYLKENPDAVSKLQEEVAPVLCKLAEFGIIRGLETLLEFGFDASKKCGSWTALHLACFTGRVDSVRVLLSHQVPVDVIDDQYHASPLGWALHAAANARSGTGDYVGIVSALVQAGSGLEEVKAALERGDLPEDIEKPLRELVREAH